MTPRLTIVGLGEALFDVRDGQSTLGGAPLNVAVHAHRLAAAAGGRGVVVSRVGRDELGRRLLDELTGRGMTTEAVQVDDGAPTGHVLVSLRDGEPVYEIVNDVAWDRLEFNDGLRGLAGSADAVCFGTLGRRSPRARETVGRFLLEAGEALRLYDVNLRPPFDDTGLIREGCQLATVVKLNEGELASVHRLLGLPGGDGSQDARANAIRERFLLDAVVLTRGKAGTALYTREGKIEGTPVSFDPEPGADSVGAGDACSAGVLVGMTLRWPSERVVALANALGAYVASRAGATPDLPESLLTEVRGGGTRETPA